MKNSLHVKRRVSAALESWPEATLGSFDVVSLFTRVPVREAIEVVGRFMRRDSTLSSRTKINLKTLCDLVEFCLTSCYFLFRSSFYVQVDGVAMGSNLGCVVANIYMRFFEEMARCTALELSLPTPLLWLRYVDDILVMLHSEEDFTRLLTLLNSLRDSIEFTLELESEGQLPFLDLSIKKGDRGVVFGVYRKPTHTDMYLNRDSCHHPHVFNGLVTGLKKRAVTVCSTSELPAELRHLRSALAKNGYTRRDLSKLNSHSMASRHRSDEGSSKRVFLPYLPGLSHKVSRCFKKAGLKVVFRPPPTLRSLLSRKKPKQIEGLGFVYRIPCSSCSWSYVGETGRSIGQRIGEHRRAVRRLAASSEIANHVLETGHQMDWSNPECLSRESSHFGRLFKEAWFSQKFKSGNRVFYDLDPTWNGFLA